MLGPCNPANSNHWDCYNAGNCHEQPILPFGAECLCQTNCDAEPPNCFSGPHCEFCKYIYCNTLSTALMILFWMIWIDNYWHFDIFTVDQCKIDYEEDGKSCSDHGYCTNDDTVSGFTCLCEPGWLGEKCADRKSISKFSLSYLYVWV